MSFLGRIGIYFYVILLSFICGMGLLFVTEAITLKEVIYYLDLAYNREDLRFSVGLVCGALIVLSFLFERFIIAGQQKEKTIAFDNPSGRVSVSLTAVEDLVKRLIYKEPEVKEVRPFIRATRKGIEIEARLVLKAEVNIPEMTARLQQLIKNKIQDTVGVEEPLVVRMHVVKIVSEQTKQKRQKEPEKENPEEVSIPFQGYRN